MLALILVLAAAPAAGQELSPEDYYFTKREAEEALDNRDWEEAATLLEDLVEHAPGDPQNWFRLMRAYRWLGRTDEALAAAQRVQEIGFQLADRISYEMAGIYAQEGDHEAALRWLERALELRYGARPRIQNDTKFEALAGDERFIALAGVLPEGELTREEGWRFDIDYVVEEARRLHIGLDGPPVSPELEATAARLKDRVGELMDDEVLLELRRLVHLLDDGHSSVASPPEDSRVDFNLARLPVRFRWFSDGLYVVTGAESAAGLVGSRVVSFGEVDAMEAAESMEPYAAMDNPMGLRNWAPYLLTWPVVLQSIGATSDPASVTLTVESPDGEMQEVVLEFGEHDLSGASDEEDEESLPLYRRNSGVNYWLEPLGEHDALYMRFSSVRNIGGGRSSVR
jgi:hypothetical protein